MTTLVVGASGATGKHLVNKLLKGGHQVKVIVRSSAILPEAWKADNNLRIIEASVSELSELEMAGLIKDCEAVASCLGHNLTWKGIYGKPRRLVTDTIDLVCRAIKKNQPSSPVRFALMNTTGVLNKDLNEPNSFAQKSLLSVLRLLLPPHVDNEQAAEYLRSTVGQNDPYIEWSSIRPYNLINADEATDYETYASPSKPAVLDPRKVSRINVGYFMADLMTNDELWNQWKGQMPVILDSIQEKAS